MQLALIPLSRGWPGGAMVLDKLSVLGRPLIWITLGQGHTALAVGAGGRILSRMSFLSSFSLSLEVGPKQTEILSQRAVKPKNNGPNPLSRTLNYSLVHLKHIYFFSVFLSYIF